MKSFARNIFLSVFAGSVLGCASLHAADAPLQVKPVSEEQAAEYKLDRNFFKKATLVQDILIATSTNVSDFTHLEAANEFDMMMKSIRPTSPSASASGKCCVFSSATRS